MENVQSGIQAPPPRLACYLTFSLASDIGAKPSLTGLLELADGDKVVMGLGSFDAFEAQLKRMVGAEDAIVDGIFQFTRPISGSYFWCPPMRSGRVDLRALGI